MYDEKSIENAKIMPIWKPAKLFENAMIVTIIGGQSLETVCNMLRQAYQRNLEQLRKFDDAFYQPGNYVYDRTKGVLEHCQKHIEILAPVRPA